MADTVDVRDHGATGDGTTVTTAALQAAIDACHASGGGRVVVPAGDYVTGTPYLRSHVELHLRSGARLVGSPHRSDYNTDDALPGDTPTPVDRASAAHLIVAQRVDDVAITGHGVIDGNASAFLGPEPTDAAPEGYRFKTGNRSVGDWRPGQSVYFFGCRRVVLRDVRLVDAPYWTVYLLGCDQVQLRGLSIENPPTTPNGDGVDIVSCRNVTVSDCLIRTGDDCLVLRTREVVGEGLPVDGPVCENVTVTNCVLTTPCNAIRIGVTDGIVRRCTLSNIVITESGVGLNVTCRYSDGTGPGAQVSDVHCADFVIDADVPFVLGPGPGAARPAAVRDVSFSRFHITARAGAQAVGSATVPLERIRFSDMDWTVHGGTDNLDFVAQVPDELSKAGHSGRAGRPALPCALYGRHLVDAELDRLRFRFVSPSPVWQRAVMLSDDTGTVVDRVRGEPTPALGQDPGHGDESV